MTRLKEEYDRLKRDFTNNYYRLQAESKENNELWEKIDGLNEMLRECKNEGYELIKKNKELLDKQLELYEENKIFRVSYDKKESQENEVIDEYNSLVSDFIKLGTYIENVKISYEELKTAINKKDSLRLDEIKIEEYAKKFYGLLEELFEKNKDMAFD